MRQCTRFGLQHFKGIPPSFRNRREHGFVANDSSVNQATRPGTRSVTRLRLRLESLEERRLLACVSDDPFICVPLQPTHEGLAVHIHPTLEIFINGVKQNIPADVGVIKNAGGTTTGFYPLHTHDATGTVHAEAPIQRDFKLEHFFSIWEQPFDSTHIMSFTADANDTITMTVNGTPNTQFGELTIEDGDKIVINATTVPNPARGPHRTTARSLPSAMRPGAVQVRRATDGSVQADFQAYGREYQGPISVAVGDVNGDGFEDVITGPSRASPHVKVFDGKAISQATFNQTTPDSHTLASFMAFGTQWNVGVNVAVGKVQSADSTVVDIIAGASVGNPHVKIFKGQSIKDGTFNANPDGQLLASFFAYDLNRNFGANVASGNVLGSDHDDVVTGPTGGNPHVKIYKGEAIGHGNFTPETGLLYGFFAFDLGQNLGAYVAVGDTNGDGFDDVICGQNNNNSKVRVYDGLQMKNGTNPLSAVTDDFFAFAAGTATGVTVGAGDFNNDGKAEILTGTTQGASKYRAIQATDVGGVNPPALQEKDLTELSSIITVAI